MTEQEAQAEAWVKWDREQYDVPPAFGGGKQLASYSAGDAFYAGFVEGAEWERSRVVAAPSDTDLRANLDKLHRWTFGAEGEWTKDVARELVAQVSDSLSQPVQVEVTDDRRERVAEAIYLVYVDEGGVDGLDSFTYPWATRTPRVRERFYRQADAALAALGGGE